MGFLRERLGPGLARAMVIVTVTVMLAAIISIGPGPSSTIRALGDGDLDTGITLARAISSLGQPCHSGVVPTRTRDVLPGATTYALWRGDGEYQLGFFSTPRSAAPTLIAAFESAPGRSVAASCARGLSPNALPDASWTVSA